VTGLAGVGRPPNADVPRPGGEVVVYEAPDGSARVDVRLDRETVWLTQQQMAELFGRERSVVTKHIRNVFKEGELDPGRVCAKFAHTAADGKTYEVEHYNEPLYPSVQARAAHLLYFLIKDHPFSDGNKRIGTLLFLEYLRRNDLLTSSDGTLRLANNAMVALALLVAESEPKQKDLMIRLILNLLEDGPG
jgi:prophage maintenance system killer protein